MAAPEKTANLNTWYSATPGTSTGWANSAWVQVIASASEAMVLGSAVISSASSGNIEGEFDVGVGSAGNEVVIATIAFCSNATGTTEWDHPTAGIPIASISSGARVAVRMRLSSSSATNPGLFFSLFPAASLGVETTTNILACVPSAAAGVSLTPNSTAWAFSSWVEIAASLTDMAISGVIINPPATMADATPVYATIELAVGSAGNEVVVASIPYMAHKSTAVEGFPCVFLDALLKLAGTQRVSVRMAGQNLSTSAWTFKLQYIPTTSFAAEDLQNTTASQSYSGELTVVAPGTGAWGSWVEVSAGLGFASIVSSLYVDTSNGASNYFVFQVGKGAAGSEVPVASMLVWRATQGGGPHQHRAGGLLIDNIAASTRIAVRAATNSLSDLQAIVRLHYCNKADL